MKSTKFGSVIFLIGYNEIIQWFWSPTKQQNKRYIYCLQGKLGHALINYHFLIVHCDTDKSGPVLQSACETECQVITFLVGGFQIRIVFFCLCELGS